jgi:truncated hemoglobin YjbI
MKSILKFASLFGVAVLLASLVGCSSGGGTAEVGKSLYAQLGRADGVAKLANQFGANIASNPTLNAILDAVAIGDVKTGLTNDIIKASAMTPPSSTTLESALAGKNIGSAGLAALSNCLTEAGKSMNLDAATISSLSGLLKPLSGK